MKLQIESEKCENKKEELKTKVKSAETQHQLHLRKAKVFSTRKTAAKKESRKNMHKEAVCIDFSKNFCCPNITTNDVYYKRQLSLYAFNVHVLSNGNSTFYMYPETIAKKGSNETTSFLHHFVYNYLDRNITELKIFCDSCGGQNKNVTMFRFLHHLVHIEKRFTSIKITFPVRGHSYLECDKNTGLINNKAAAEIPYDWIDIFKLSRNKPAPFHVEKVNQDMVKNWTNHLDKLYKKKLTFESRPVKELKILEQHSTLISYRTTYNGAWLQAPVLQPKAKRQPMPKLQPGEFILPEQAYDGKILLICTRSFTFYRLFLLQDYYQYLPKNIRIYRASRYIVVHHPQNIFHNSSTNNYFISSLF